MPKLYSLEKPSKEKTEALIKELDEYRELKPRLTFLWPLTEGRRKAVEMITSGKIDTKEVLGLLKSDDFIEGKAGLYLLSKIPKFSKKATGTLLPLLEKMSLWGDRNVQEVAVQVLGNLDVRALPILERMSKDEYSNIRGEITEAKAKIAARIYGAKALPMIEKMIESRHCSVRSAATQAKAKLMVEIRGEKALPLLEKMSRNSEIGIQRAAIKAMGNLGAKALPILKEMAGDKTCLVKESVAQALGNIGEKALPILEKMSQGEDWSDRKAVANTLANFGAKKILPVLERMSQSEHYDVRRTVVQALENLGQTTKKVSSLLEQLSQDKDWGIREAAKRVLVKIKGKVTGRQWLLSTRKPLFATPHTEKLAQRILKLERISQELKDKFKDKFIGITIFGSVAKGYSRKESDLDWAVIAKGREALDYFQDIADSLKLCFEHYAGVNEKYEMQGRPDILFYGLFFGDRQKLLELQKKTLENIDKEEWDRIRDRIRERETNLEKATERFYISEYKEIEKLRQLAALLRVPLSYQKTLEIIRSRAK